MSKTNEKLNELKKEVEAVNEKLQELTPEEIALVSGGSGGTGKGGCTGGTPESKKCAGCSCYVRGTCTLSGKVYDR